MGHPEFPAGCDSDTLQSRGSNDAWPSHGVSDSGDGSLFSSSRPESFSRATGFREAMASDATGLEHISVFLYEPESSIRSDWPDRFRSRRLQPAAGQIIHRNRGGQYKHAQEPGRRWLAATRLTEGIFQIVERSANDERPFRRHRHELVARCEFRIRCY